MDPVPSALATTRPLTCPTCGGLVPLGEAEAAPCPFCKASVPLPAEYLELRKARRALEAERTEALGWYRRLVVAPRWVQTFAAIETVVVVVAVGIPILLLLALDYGQGVVAWLLRAADPLLGVDVLDRFGWMPTMMTVGLLVLVSFAAPVVVARYAAAFDQVRRQVLSAYAARPPGVPTGPSTCRNCGAALDVKRGDLGVPCLYCGADNLIAADTSSVAAAQGKAAEARHKIDAAVASLPQARQEGRQAIAEMAKTAAGVLVAFSLFLLGVLVTAQERDGADTVPDWAVAYGPPRQVIPYRGKHTSGAEEGIRLGQPHDLAMSNCYSASCVRSFYVALDAGEKLTVSSPSVADAQWTWERNGPHPKRTALAWAHDGSSGGAAEFVQSGYRSFVVLTVTLPQAKKAAEFTWAVSR